MIRNYQQFILENTSTEISDLIDDTFVEMCDSHGLDFRTQDGFFVNTIGDNRPINFLPERLFDDVKKLFDEQNEEMIVKKSIQITFLKSESWSNNWVGEISDESKVEKLNKDFNSCVDKFNRMNKTNFHLSHLPDEIKSTFWQIVFYVVEN